MLHIKVECSEDIIHKPKDRFAQRRKSELPLPNSTIQALARHKHPDDHLSSQKET